MSKAGQTLRNAVFITTLAVTLTVSALWAKKPQVEPAFGRMDTVSTVQMKAPSAPALKATDLKPVRFEEVDARFMILLEDHRDASHRIAAAKLMEQNIGKPYRPNARNRFFIEFLEHSWKDSLEAYLRQDKNTQSGQDNDTLSVWLNQKLYKCSKRWDSTALVENHSYAKLVLTAKKNKREVQGIYISYNSYDMEHTVHGLDSLYANTLIRATQNDGQQKYVALFGGWHYGISSRLNKTLRKNNKQAVNVLLWDKKLDPMQATKIHVDEFKEKFSKEVLRPLIDLDVKPGLYRINPKCGYARDYGIKYILVVDEKADVAMPPVQKK